MVMTGVDAEFGEASLTFSQVQTNLGGDFVATRHGEVSAGGTALALEEDEFGGTTPRPLSPRARETVG
jgi:hypothetical protein